VGAPPAESVSGEHQVHPHMQANKSKRGKSASHSYAVGFESNSSNNNGSRGNVGVLGVELMDWLPLMSLH